MKNITLRLVCLTGITIFISSACFLPGSSVIPLGPKEQTSAAETVVAAVVQTQLVQLTIESSLPVVATPQPEEASTQTLEPTATITLTLEPSLTPTPPKPMISVSQNTNCRKGNAKNYDYVGALVIGEQAEILARDSGNYWYVRLPSGTMCWLWGQYGTITGDTSQLPVFTPPPSPTPAPDFTFTYKSIGVGPGYQCFMVEVQNTGSLTWESYSLNFHDVTHGDTASSSRNDFTSFDMWCVVAASKVNIPPGDSGVASVTTNLAYNPAGDTMEFTLKMCSQDGLGGTCLTKTISIIY